MLNCGFSWISEILLVNAEMRKTHFDFTKWVHSSWPYETNHLRWYLSVTKFSYKCVLLFKCSFELQCVLNLFLQSTGLFICVQKYIFKCITTPDQILWTIRAIVIWKILSFLYFLTLWFTGVCKNKWRRNMWQLCYLFIQMLEGSNKISLSLVTLKNQKNLLQKNFTSVRTACGIIRCKS